MPVAEPQTLPAPVVEPYDERPPALPRVPWSRVRGEFVTKWGYADGRFDPEHLEILGPSGSGKTYFEATVLRDRVKARKSGVVFIATKQVDATIMKLGWPVVDTVRGVRENPQCVFWPRTKKVGRERKAYLAAKIRALLSWLFRQAAKIIVVVDEEATMEELSMDVKDLMRMYYREGRSSGITLVSMKQRPQGAVRDMHSETSWTAAFHPKDEDDAVRVAQVLGSRRRWMPVLQSLDRAKRELILHHAVSDTAVITWVDVPLTPATPRRAGLYRGGPS